MKAETRIIWWTELDPVRVRGDGKVTCDRGRRNRAIYV
jgi:hypothetical protein